VSVDDGGANVELGFRTGLSVVVMVGGTSGATVGTPGRAVGASDVGVGTPLGKGDGFLKSQYGT